MPPIPPEQAALSWVPGRGPVELKTLTSGLVNDSWQVERDGRRYSLRRSRVDGADLGLDRAWECRVLAEAAAAGVAPAIAHCAPGDGILIAEWVAGTTWTADEALAPANAAAMASLLRRVHTLPLPQTPRAMSPRAWLEHYAAAARRRQLPMTRSSVGMHAAAALHLGRLAALPVAAPVLCHGDLHRLNLAVSDRLVLLDWEYAHAAEPLWDVAGWVCNNDASDAAAGAFLADYLGRPAAGFEAERLDLLRWLYDFVCLVWSELYLTRLPAGDSRPASGGEVAERARMLTVRLAAGSTAAPGGRAGQVPAH